MSSLDRFTDALLISHSIQAPFHRSGHCPAVTHLEQNLFNQHGFDISQAHSHHLSQTQTHTDTPNVKLNFPHLGSSYLSYEVFPSALQNYGNSLTCWAAGSDIEHTHIDIYVTFHHHTNLSTLFWKVRTNLNLIPSRYVYLWRHF